MVDVEGFDLAHLTPAFLVDPCPTYRALREQAPVKRMPDGRVFLVQHANHPQVWHDAQTFSSGNRGGLDELAVSQAMCALPVGCFKVGMARRVDGRVLHDLTLHRVKTPGGNKAAWNHPSPLKRVAAGKAFLCN